MQVEVLFYDTNQSLFSEIDSKVKNIITTFC